MKPQAHLDALRLRLITSRNAAHYPDLPGAPHHVHIGDETAVEPGKPITLLDLIDLLEQTIDL